MQFETNRKSQKLHEEDLRSKNNWQKQVENVLHQEHSEIVRRINTLRNAGAESLEPLLIHLEDILQRDEGESGTINKFRQNLVKAVLQYEQEALPELEERSEGGGPENDSPGETSA